MPKHDPVVPYSSSLSAITAALIALLPGALALWWGRGIARLADDPVLPERLLANRSRNAAVTIAAFLILTWTSLNHLAWALPLLIGTRMAAGYPLRKIVHRETWSLGGYLSFFSRLIVASFGFWIVIATLPVLTMLAGSHDWIIATAAAVVLVAWSEAYTSVFCGVLRARPMEDPVIVSRFTQMAEVCGLQAVRLAQVDLRGGTFANAAALPSIREPAVVVSSTLVERLDHDEVAAILAHELAHVEQFKSRRFRHARLAGYPLIAAAALFAPAVHHASPQTFAVILFAWPLIFIMALARLARSRQKHETASDLRAIALTGQPDALVRALTKLHAIAHVPRRWDVEFERQASHPSLARRIQAIQAAAGSAPAALGGAATFTGAGEPSSVTFHEDHLVWIESASASHTIDYRHLTMLRVEARASGTPRLVAVDSARRRWEVVLQPVDIARAQATLDIVDTRLGAIAVPQASSLAVARCLAGIVAGTCMVVGQHAVLLVALLAAVQPASPLTAALGAAAIGGAGLIWRDHLSWTTGIEPWVAMMLCVLGLTLLAIRFVNRHERPSALASKLIGVLAVGALAAWFLVGFSGASTIDLHRAARDWPAATLLAFALAGAFVFERSRHARYAAMAFTLAAVAAGFLGTTTFLDSVADDPFLAQGGPVRVKKLSAAALAEFEVGLDVDNLWLSPAGSYLAVSTEDRNEAITIHAGLAGGSLTSFTADEALFVDDGRLMLLERQRRGSMLRVVDLETGRELWSRNVPLSSARLSLERASKTWRLLGWNGDGEIGSIAGRVGSDEVREERWKSPSRGVDAVDALSASNGDVLALETHYLSGPFDRGRFRAWAAMMRSGYRTESRFWTVGEHGSAAFATSRLDLACRSGSLDDEGTRCTAFDGTRTGIFALDPRTRRSIPLASVTGRFTLRGESAGGWLTGWWDRAMVLVRAATHEAIVVEGHAGDRPFQLAVADHVVGTVSWGENGSTIRLYSLE